MGWTEPTDPRDVAPALQQVDGHWVSLLSVEGSISRGGSVNGVRYADAAENSI